MSTSRIVGIDPGLRGGLALVVPILSAAYVEEMPIAGKEIDAAELALCPRNNSQVRRW